MSALLLEEGASLLGRRSFSVSSASKSILHVWLSKHQTAAMGRYVEVYIATPMHSLKLCGVSFLGSLPSPLMQGIQCSGLANSWT